LSFQLKALTAPELQEIIDDAVIALPSMLPVGTVQESVGVTGAAVIVTLPVQLAV
jgi:hypothetical protein